MTLIEMIVAIVVTGILVALTAMFMRNQVQSYTDVATRAQLVDEADTALRRMARDLQSALPNSVRVTGGFIEFVPVLDAGRYRAETGAGAGNPLDFSTADGSFDVLGPGVTVAAGNQLVVYNLGIPGGDVYDGSSRRALTSFGSGLSTLTYTVGAAQFTLASPQNRFQIVGQPVTYALDGAGTLWRYTGYGFQAAQVATIAGLGALPGVTRSALVTGVTAASTFTYVAGALQRNGVVAVRLVLARNGETVDLLHQIGIQNTP